MQQVNYIDLVTWRGVIRKEMQIKPSPAYRHRKYIKSVKVLTDEIQL